MIDTHLHLIYPDRFTYRWTEGIPALQGAFPLSAYQNATAGCGVSGAIFMEVDADESAGEVRYFCELAEQPASGLLGIVASARPEQEGFFHGVWLD